MNILILTQYYPPEIGAPQNRLRGLATRLQSMGAEVTILTAMPNYPQMEVWAEYRGKWSHFEEIDGLKVYRSYIYCSRKSSIFRRLLNYFSFMLSSIIAGLSKIRETDLIICESPPLTSGITALILKWRLGARLLFNVSDLWPESAKQLNLVSNKWVLSLAEKLELYIYRHSEMITGQTRHIVNDIKRRTGHKSVHWLPNGIDLELYRSYIDPEGSQALKNERTSWRQLHQFAEDDFLILYAGILGYAQNLEVILHAAAILKKQQRVKFLLLGTGPRKASLLKMKNKLDVNNVMFLDPVEKGQMPSILNSIDAGVVPLLDREIFRGAIPSKIFEILIMQKPLLLGVEGEAKYLFIDETACGLAFKPENAESLAENVKWLLNNTGSSEQFGRNGQKLVKERFTMDKIADDLWDIIQRAFPNTPPKEL